MIISLASVNLAGLAIGQSPPPVSLNAVDSYRAVLGKDDRAGWLAFYNESGAGLGITMSGGRTFRLPAGAWQYLKLVDADESFSATVLYTLPNPPVSLLLPVFYSPDEGPPQIGVLGNSPIGVSSVPVSVNQVINDNNPLVTTVLEATPSGGSSSAKINNDGSGYLSAGLITYDNAGNLSVNGLGLDFNTGGSTTEYRVPFTGAAKGQLFYAWNGSAIVNILALGIRNNALAFIDMSGNIIAPSVNGSGTSNLVVAATAPGRVVIQAGNAFQSDHTILLTAGNQESGVCGTGTNAGSATVYFVANFKTTMTNTPSSITLATITSNGVSSGPVVDSIDVRGFLAHVNFGAVGGTWFGTYTTVGN